MLSHVSHQGKASQDSDGTALQTHWDDYESKDTTGTGAHVENLEPSYFAGRNLKWGHRFGKTVQQFLKKST